jgi:hypothetical protein
MWFIYLVIWFVFGFTCSNMAENRGRNNVLGFLGGFFFGFLSVIYYWIVGDTFEMKLIKQKQMMNWLKE